MFCAMFALTHPNSTWLVQRNNKSRLQVCNGRIRASQGHSTAGMPVTQDALEASWLHHQGEALVWHGTGIGAALSIAKSGILPVTRTHVHLAADLESRVGKRAGVAVMLGVAPARLRSHGHDLFVSENGVVLTRDVPPDCIVELVCISPMARKRQAELRQRFGSVQA
jgi:putative RNA 2'-phosphotransferase